MSKAKNSRAPHTVLIGGTKGLGKTVARLFAQAHHRVSLVARQAPDEALADLEGVSFYPTDLLENREIESSMKKILADHGTVDHVIFLQRSRMPKGTAGESWQNELQVSLVASQIIIDALSPGFAKDRGGAIVFVSSMGGMAYADSQPLEYGIAKAGFNQMVRHYCATLGARQIRVNGVACFTFLKEESQEFFLKDEKLQATIKKTVPLQRWATALDMAQAIEFLCSDRAQCISGQVLVIDGGLSAIGQETVAFWATGMRERPL